MADLEKTVKVIFSGEDERLSKAISAIGGKFSALEGVVGNVTGPLASAADSVLKLDAALAALAIGGMALAIKKAGDFSGAIGEITTLIDATGDQTKKFEGDILSYSQNSSKGIADINAAIYNAISAGVDWENSIEMVSTAEKLSIAGKADLNTTTKVLVSTLNAYGESAEAAAKYSDIMFTTVRLGQTTLSELANSLAQVTGLAANTGVPFETLSAAIAALTVSGLPTSQAITGLKAALQGIVKPTSQAAEMADALGIQFNAAALKTRGFENILKDAYAAADGNTEKLAQLFGSVEALNAVLVLSADKTGKFKTALADMQNAAGATVEAYNKVADDFANVNQRIINAMDTTIITIGQRIQPGYKDIGEDLSNIFAGIKVGVDSGAFDDLFEMLDKVKASVAEFLAGMAAALPEALKGLEFDNLLDALRQLGEAFRSYFGDIDLTAVEDLHDFIQLLIDGITGLIRITAGMVEGFRPFFIAIKDFLMGMAQGDTEAQKMLGTVMALAKAVETFGLALAASAVAADQYGAKVTGVFSTVAGAAQVLWNGLQLVANAIQGLFVVLESVLIELLDTLSFGLFSEKFDRMREVVNETGKKISESMMENGMDAARGLDRLIGGLSELGGQSHKTAEEVSAAGKKIADSVPEKVVTEWQFEGIDNVKKALADIGKTIVGVDEVSLEETKTEIVEVLGDTHKIDVEVDLDEEDLKKKAASVDKALEWRARLDMAEAEAAVKKFKDAAESVNVGIKDTGDLISDLFRQLGQSGRWNESIIRDQIASENEMRRKQFELQEKLIGQQIELNDLKLSNARDGKMMIDINAAGLQPHLEMILWEILEQIQIRANATSAEFLLGL